MGEQEPSPSRHTLDYQFDILTDEWKSCQTHIGRLDDIRLGVRGWAIAIFSAFVGVAATERLPLLMLLGVGALGLCWYVDAANKLFQEVFKARSRTIEAYLRSEAFTRDIRAGYLTFEGPNLSDADHEGAGLIGQLRLLARWGSRPTIVGLYFGLVIMCLFALGLLYYIAPPDKAVRPPPGPLGHHGMAPIP